MIQLGDKIKRRVGIYNPERPCGTPAKVTVDATVVYIHPQRRYFVLEYNCPGGNKYRESEFFN